MSDLGSFLAAFPAATVAAIDRLAADGRVVMADAATRRFRVDPATALGSVRAQFQDLPGEAASPEMAWCYEGDPAAGIDGFEVSAVLDRHLEVIRVEQVMAGATKRVVAFGRPRGHSVVLASNVSGLSDSDLTGVFHESTNGGWPGTLLFLTRNRIAAVAANETLRAGLHALTHSGGALGLFVTDAEADLACAEPAAYLEPVRRSGLSIQATHFERGLAIEPAQLDRFMRIAGVGCDTSVPIDSGAAVAGQTARSAAYAGPTPYFPQPFDLRVPWFSAEPRPWIELPMFRLAGADAVADWWVNATWPDDATLIERLDGRRIEAYFRASRVSPELEHRYPDYRIYNAPRPAPSERVSLLDVATPSVTRLAAAKRSLDEVRRKPGARLEFARANELVSLARVEATRRYDLSTTGAIEVQHATHVYLGDIPRSAPLREDYAEFARFIDAELGDAVEIGSGYGVLAWTLSPRSRRYVCMDLDARMFSALRADLGQSGVVADAHTMPFADASVDSIIANNVLEHFYDPLKGLREICRVLRPGGRLFALLPFDALNSRHDLPAHLWKLDLEGVRNAVWSAGLDLARVEVIDLHALGVPGAFPSCNGLVAMVDAGRPPADKQGPTAVVRVRAIDAPKPRSTRAGRLWPSIREHVRFENWNGRRVLTVGAAADDVEEFRHFGALVTERPASVPFAGADASADLVYVFLAPARAALAGVASEIDRVMAPGGRAVVILRNRDSFRFLSRVGSYFGEACELFDLLAPDRLLSVAEGEPAELDEYVDAAEIAQGFERFGQKRVRMANLMPEDLAGDGNRLYPEAFWKWMDETFGRFAVVSLAR